MWVLFSILAALCWAIVSIIDKYVFSKWVSNPLIPVTIFCALGLLSSFFIFSFRGFYELSYQNIFLCFLAGAFFILASVLYFKAVKIEEISRVVPLYYLTPLFTSVFAVFFLDEIFAPIKYLGIFLLVIGAVLISLRSLTDLRPGNALLLMILASIFYSLSAIATKYLLSFADFWTIFAYIRLLLIFALVPMLYFCFRDLVETVKKHGKKVIVAISLAEALTLIGTLLITIAMSIGSVTLVNALSSIQPFIVLLFAVILSVFFPKILKEEINKQVIFLKILAIALMFVGVILII